MITAWAPWTDASGLTTMGIIYAAGAADAADILADIQAVSTATVGPWYAAAVSVPLLATPVSGAYQGTDVIADLTFATSGGALVHVWVPGPAAHIFMPDHETVDPAEIATLRATVLAKMLSPSGSPVGTYIQGFRRSLMRRNYR